MSKFKKNSYNHSIPTPNELINFFQKNTEPKTLDELCIFFDIRDSKKKKSLQRALYNISKEKLIKKNKRGEYHIPMRQKPIDGRVIENIDGFGFVVTHDQEDDIYLSSVEMRSLMDGDEVQVKLNKSNRGRKSGKLLKILNRNNKRICGKLDFSKGKYILSSYSKNSSKKVIINKNSAQKCKIGQFVEVLITKYPTKSDSIIYGKISSVIGDESKEGIYVDLAIRAFDIPVEWPQDINNDLKKINSEGLIENNEINSRIDLRRYNFITIDGQNARDFDDAIYCESFKNGWKLYIAIADVDHYVEHNSSLDKEACKRGTSVYFHDRVIPMLPVELSNGLCSLRPNEERLAIVCELEISQSGKVSTSRFYESVIESKARLTYSQVYNYLETNKLNSLSKNTANLLSNLYRLYLVQKKLRKKRGAIDLDIPQISLITNNDGSLKTVQKEKRNDAHKIIEECMIIANVEAAKFLKKSKLPILYRNHEKPNSEGFEDLFSFLKKIRIKIPDPKNIKPNDFDFILSQLNDNPNKNLISMMMLRTFSQAKYSPEVIGHFGLALGSYTHFTSPIRRYPDLLVHRAIRFVLQSKKTKKYHYSNDKMKHLGDLCSSTERRAEKAVRDVETIMKCQFMQNQIGSTFSGTIASVHAFGVFVQIDNLLVEGLVHVSNMKKDYFMFDRSKKILIGERTKKIIRIGDQLNIKVLSVDLDTRKINLNSMDL